MNHSAPRAMTPRDGVDWLRQALQLMLRRPALFIAVAAMAPCGSALLLKLPGWQMAPFGAGAWWHVVTTVLCYALPSTFVISLACGLARAMNREHFPTLRQLLNPTVGKVLLKSTLFLSGLIVQGYLAAYLLWDLFMLSAAVTKSTANPVAFGAADTLLATQGSVLGSLLLLLQFLGACFVPPLQLFREGPLYHCWRSSFLAIQLNPWLLPSLSLGGCALVLVSFVDALAIPAQILAFPLPAYLGALLYIAWMNLFQGGVEEKAAQLDAATV